MRGFSGYIALILLLTAAGCQHGSESRSTAVEENGKFKLSVNVEEAAAPQAQPPVAPAEKRVASPGQKKSTTRRQTPTGNPAAREKVSVPPPSGAIDVELNSVERSYVQEVRARHQQQSRANEQKVFGGFSVEGLIKGK